MIDTIAINLDAKDFEIIDHKKFSPSSAGIFQPPYMEFGSKRILKCICNPTKKQIEQYGYMPRLTLFKAVRRGGFAIYLRVEFSVPKLLFNNNFNEVTQIDFPKIAYTLRKLLLYMGVKVSGIEAIYNATVSSVHFSKNIILTDFTDPYFYTSIIERVDISKLYDVTRTNYRNEGHALRYHSSNYEVIFYDKVKDLTQGKVSDGRSVEDENFTQLDLLEVIKERKPFEVLRIEVRFGNKKRLQAELNKRNVSIEDYSFKSVFNEELSKLILLSLVKDIEKNYPAILYSSTDSFEALLVELQIQNPSMKMNQALALLGAAALLSENGIRKTRNLLDRYGNSSWYRLKKKMQLSVVPTKKGVLRTVIDSIEQFSPVNIDFDANYYA